SEDKLASTTAELEQPKSTEEQQLEMRRSSSVTKLKSRLSDVTPVAESHPVTAEPETKKPSSPIAVPKPELSFLPKPAERPRQHRGSDIGEASPEEIRALERRMSIPEEPEE